MLQKTRLPILALCALCALPAWADDAVTPSPLTSNISLVSDYLFRGVSRTNGTPAVQGGIDLMTASGLYVGTWGSNISWLADQGFAKGSSLELDVYLGVKKSFFTDFTYDFGLLRYHFPAVYNPGMVNADTQELHAALGYQWLSVKYSYATGNAFGIDGSKGTHYLDISANYPISDSGFTVGAHYGRQTYKGTTAATMKQNGLDPSYSDFNVSLSKDLNGFVLGAAYSGTMQNEGTYYTSVQGNSLRRHTFVLSLKRTY